jgi:hypothetical protein
MFLPTFLRFFFFSDLGLKVGQELGGKRISHFKLTKNPRVENKFLLFLIWKTGYFKVNINLMKNC